MNSRISHLDNSYISMYNFPPVLRPEAPIEPPLALCLFQYILYQPELRDATMKTLYFAPKIDFLTTLVDEKRTTISERRGFSQASLIRREA